MCSIWFFLIKIYTISDWIAYKIFGISMKRKQIHKSVSLINREPSDALSTKFLRGNSSQLDHLSYVTRAVEWLRPVVDVHNNTAASRRIGRAGRRATNAAAERRPAGRFFGRGVAGGNKRENANCRWCMGARGAESAWRVRSQAASGRDYEPRGCRPRSTPAPRALKLGGAAGGAV